MRGGTQASSIALHELTSALEAALERKSSLREAILDGIEAANREVVTLAIGAATTIVIAEIHKGSLRPYHVGDSGILAFGQKGKLKLQTMFHSPTGYAVESGLMDERAALKHDERHLVSNVIGTPDMRIEMGGRIDLAAKDTVLLASDGLFDNLHTAEIVETLRKGPLEQAIGELAAAARKRMASENGAQPGKPDDLTLVGFRLE
jgi:serine/threonine protein phosphatase PrpC